MATFANKLKGFTVARLERSMAKDAHPFNKLFDPSWEVKDVCHAMNVAIRDARGSYAADPISSAWHSYGFARILDCLPFLELEWEDDTDLDPNDMVFIPLDNGQIFGILERRERILPGDTLREAVQKEGDKLAKRQGEPPNRKQWAELKDTVAATLLAKALIKTRRVPVLFQPSVNSDNAWDVFYFTTSHKIAEDMNAALFRRVFGSYPVYPFENDLTLPIKLLLTKILDNTYASEMPWNFFSPGYSAKLVDHLAGGSAYSFKDQTLRDSNGEFDPLVKEALDQGYQVDNMTMKFYGSSPVDNPSHYLTMKLNAKGVFSGLKMSDVLVAERGSVDDSSASMDFHAYMYLLTDSLGSIIRRLEDTSNIISPEKVYMAQELESEDQSSDPDVTAPAEPYDEDDQL